MNVDLFGVASSRRGVIPVAKPMIVIVEDDSPLVQLLRYNLESAGYGVCSSTGGETGLRMISEMMPDLVILDWMLPEMPGIDVLQELRRQAKSRTVPIMMLSARYEEKDRIHALDMGADDYVPKPFSVQELMLRIKNIMRRATSAEPTTQLRHEVLHVGDIIVDIGAHRVTRAGMEVRPHPVAFDLLIRLMGSPGKVFERDPGHCMDQHVCRLRRALKRGGRKDPIVTVRGEGYSFDKDYKS